MSQNRLPNPQSRRQRRLWYRGPQSGRREIEGGQDLTAARPSGLCLSLSGASQMPVAHQTDGFTCHIHPLQDPRHQTQGRAWVCVDSRPLGEVQRLIHSFPGRSEGPGCTLLSAHYCRECRARGSGGASACTADSLGPLTRPVSLHVLSLLARLSLGQVLCSAVKVL